MFVQVGFFMAKTVYNVPMGRAAYGLDVDNTVFDARLFKEYLGSALHDRFAVITPDLFRQTYASYCTEHRGVVNMHAILRDTATVARLSFSDTNDLLTDFLETLPYEQYVFPGMQYIMHQLGPERIFLFTKTGDLEFQQKKLEACHLPVAPDHICICEGKTQQDFDRWIGNIRETGATHFVYATDEPYELLRAEQSSRTFGLPFEGIHHLYGSHYLEHMEEAQTTLGDHYHRADGPNALRGALFALHDALEGTLLQEEHALSYGPERI